MYGAPSTNSKDTVDFGGREEKFLKMTEQLAASHFVPNAMSAD